jgi:hypothetical protein
MSPDEVRKRSGGIFFFFSLLALLLVGTWNVRFLVSVLATWGLKFPLILAVSAAIGWILAKFLIRAHLSTFIHELKHAVLSNLVGNRAKGMKIRRDTGYFKYEYTEETARYNAFISLAPYCLPLFTAPTLGLASWLIDERLVCTAVVGIALGFDLQTGWRDVGAHQTDFIDLRGGYFIGLVYVCAATVTLVSIVVAWAAGGWSGVGQLMAEYFRTLRMLVG